MRIWKGVGKPWFPTVKKRRKGRRGMREYYNRGTGEEKRGSREDLGKEGKERLKNYYASSPCFPVCCYALASGY
jgi:hypothetical protein